MIKEEIAQVGLQMGKLESSLILLVLSLFLIPVVLIRQFNRIKFLGVLIMICNSLIVIQALVFFIIERSTSPVVRLEPKAIPKDQTTSTIPNYLIFICHYLAELQSHHKYSIISCNVCFYESILPFIPRFSFAFEYQVYFMIVYPYLGDTKKSQRGMQLATATSSLMLVYCLVFSMLAMGSKQIVLNSYGIVELYYGRVSQGRDTYLGMKKGGFLIL